MFNTAWAFLSLTALHIGEPAHLHEQIHQYPGYRFQNLSPVVATTLRRGELEAKTKCAILLNNNRQQARLRYLSSMVANVEQSKMNAPIV